jgi:hypothetical protein
MSSEQNLLINKSERENYDVSQIKGYEMKYRNAIIIITKVK